VSGSIFKRCTKCSTRVKARSCARCGHTAFRWAFAVDLGKDATGKRIQRLRGGFPTKAEAERALIETKSALHRGQFVERSRLTVGEYLLEEWIAVTGPPRVRWETWDDRRRNLENHVIPRLGAIPLQDLNAGHVNKLYTDLLVEGRKDGAGGLSPASVRRIHAMLRKALRDAVRWGRVERNVTDFADPPPARVVQAARRRSMTTWNEQELLSFLTGTASHRLHPLWVFAATSGTRRSEFLGLRWGDVNLNASTVTIRQTVVMTPDGYRLELEQKSVTSGRTLHLSARTVAELQLQRERQQHQRRVVGTAWQEHDLVFPQDDGSWWNPPAITLAFSRAVRKADVRPIRLHDLRHTHASLLLAAGVNPKVVSERLGHSSVAFTLDTYAHVMPGMQPEAAELFDELIYGSAGVHASHPYDDQEETSGRQL
jgi:integrase